MHKIFTYGTLLENRPYTHRIKAQMWNVGMFPCVKLGGESYVPGQILYVTDEDLVNLDRYEGVPHMYTRQLVNAMALDTEDEEKAWVYEWARDTDGLESLESWR